MRIPEEQHSNAIALGKRMLDDPKTEILYAHKNGCVLRDEKCTLSITPSAIDFEPRKDAHA